MTCANSAPPLELSWENVTVSEDGKAITRGISLAVGNPKQSFSLRPSVGDANTWLLNSADCVSSKNDSYIGLTGGAYDSHRSTTFQQTTEAAWNGTHDEAISEGSFIFFNDDIYFGSNGSSPAFPLYMDQPGWGESGLGKGPGSTFLSSTVACGAAPTEAWGLWVGSRSIADPADGALIIGGYDTSRYYGEFTKFTTFDTCATCVTVTNITYISPGTGAVSLFLNDTERLSVALEPFSRALEVPEEIFVNFAAITNGTVGADFGTRGLLTYPSKYTFGNLSVTLSNGFETTALSDFTFSCVKWDELADLDVMVGDQSCRG